MASININSDINDPFYRYKMPRIIAKVEGKGNGIKTVIVNMPEVAKALSRPPTYTTKFFGCELGAQTQVDLKNDRFIVNGSHDSPRLQQLLDIFIKKFVLCPECHNPETVLSVSQKKQTIGQRCIACGYNGMVDMRHKLTPFIIKNPPDMDPAATPTKASKKEKKKSKKSDKDKDDDRASPEVNTQEQMAAQRASGGIIDAPVIKNPAEEDDEDWGEDFSEDAVKQRMEELSEAAKQMAFTDDLEKTIEERLNIFYHFVKNKINSSEGVVGAMKEIFSEAERLEVKDKGTMVLVELLLNNKIILQLKQYKLLFLKFCYENDKAQKYLLGGLEQLVGVHKDDLLPKMPHILKTLYDFDILDEKVLIDWGEKVSKKYVDKKLAEEIHNKSQPFIRWLKEAEEEESDSDEEDEDDENVEVVYSHSGKVGEVKEEKKVEQEEDDFDIDAI
ncbi:eukaryotic translation initiation factor 5-like [Mytilus trossulus]|uniref:eukaryotic translation initiation factor 5-like n=1 Tax=Mytilus trossulus TaxID=6551 RepID=UPI003007A1ED